MLEAKAVTKQFSDLGLIKKLIMTQFPRNERVPIRMLLWKAKASKSSTVDFLAFYAGDLFVGFTYMFTNDDITFVAFLAVDSTIQSKGYGSQILKYVKTLYPNNRIVLGIESLDESADNYKQRVKRKEFYIKNGYESAGFKIKALGAEFEMLITGGDGSISSDECLAFYGRNIYGAFLHRIFKIFIRVTTINK